jgi:hypothetical protein
MKMTKYQGYTDDELVEIRKSMPKYLNDMTEDQKEISLAVYAEQKARFDARKAEAFADYNRQVEAAGYKVGDRVSYFARSIIGFGGMVVKGTVGKRKKYHVVLDCEFNGKKTAHLTNAWRIEPCCENQ